MGRNKLPDSVKKMRGSDQPCRMSGDSAFSLATEIVVPTYLTADAKKAFKSVAQRLMANRLLSDLDYEAVELYAINYARCVKAEKMIKQQGEVVLIKDEDGNLIKQEENVWLKVQRESIKVINNVGAQFGFSPISRVKLAALLKEKEVEKDDFSDFEEL